MYSLRYLHKNKFSKFKSKLKKQKYIKNSINFKWKKKIFKKTFFRFKKRFKKKFIKYNFNSYRKKKHCFFFKPRKFFLQILKKKKKKKLKIFRLYSFYKLLIKGQFVFDDKLKFVLIFFSSVFIIKFFRVKRLKLYTFNKTFFLLSRTVSYVYKLLCDHFYLTGSFWLRLGYTSVNLQRLLVHYRFRFFLVVFFIGRFFKIKALILFFKFLKLYKSLFFNFLFFFSLPKPRQNLLKKKLIKPNNFQFFFNLVSRSKDFLFNFFCRKYFPFFFSVVKKSVDFVFSNYLFKNRFLSFGKLLLFFYRKCFVYCFRRIFKDYIYKLRSKRPFYKTFKDSLNFFFSFKPFTKYNLKRFYYKEIPKSFWNFKRRSFSQRLYSNFALVNSTNILKDSILFRQKFNNFFFESTKFRFLKAQLVFLKAKKNKLFIKNLKTKKNKLFIKNLKTKKNKLFIKNLKTKKNKLLLKFLKHPLFLNVPIAFKKWISLRYFFENSSVFFNRLLAPSFGYTHYFKRFRYLKRFFSSNYLLVGGINKKSKIFFLYRFFFLFFRKSIFAKNLFKRISFSNCLTGHLKKSKKFSYKVKKTNAFFRSFFFRFIFKKSLIRFAKFFAFLHKISYSHIVRNFFINLNRIVVLSNDSSFFFEKQNYLKNKNNHALKFNLPFFYNDNIYLHRYNMVLSKPYVASLFLKRGFRCSIIKKLNNIFVNFLNLRGTTVKFTSTGTVGFSKKKKRSPLAAETVGKSIGSFIGLKQHRFSVQNVFILASVKNNKYTVLNVLKGLFSSYNKIFINSQNNFLLNRKRLDLFTKIKEIRLKFYLFVSKKLAHNGCRYRKRRRV